MAAVADIGVAQSFELMAEEADTPVAEELAVVEAVADTAARALAQEPAVEAGLVAVVAVELVGWQR